jgi:hypothetical protein
VLIHLCTWFNLWLSCCLSINYEHKFSKFPQKAWPALQFHLNQIGCKIQNMHVLRFFCPNCPMY